MIPAPPHETDGQEYAHTPEEEHARDGHGFGGGWCVHVMCLGTNDRRFRETWATARDGDCVRPPEW